MKRLILLFPSIHYVLEAERRLKEHGLLTELVPVPKELKGDCGMALLIHPEEWPTVSGLWKEGLLKIEACYEKEGRNYRPLPLARTY